MTTYWAFAGTEQGCFMLLDRLWGYGRDATRKGVYYWQEREVEKGAGRGKEEEQVESLAQHFSSFFLLPGRRDTE